MPRRGGRAGSGSKPRSGGCSRRTRVSASKNTVAALMAEMGLAARPKRRRRATTRPGKGRWRAPDLVKRDFPAQGINRKWYGDGTEIPTGEGKLQLASVLDMGSRRIVGFALGEHHDAELAYGALAMAVAVRGGQVPGVIMHTDQGRRVHRGPVPASLRPAVHLPVDGPARVGAGQRRHRIVALDPGIRGAARRALRDQGGRPGRGRGLDRGLQPPPPALRAGQDLARGLRAVPDGKGRRVRAARPAARPRTRRRRLRRRIPPATGCRAVAGGRAAPGYGAVPQHQGRL